MNKDTETIFQECLESLFRGEATEDSLKRYPEYAEELRPLLQMATLTRRAVQTQPNTDFKARLREQLLVIAREMKTRPVHVTFTRRSVWTAGVAVALAVLIAMGSTVGASSNSMPDGILYPVKLTSERVWLALHVNTISKLEYSAQLANERVAELIYELGHYDNDVDTTRLEEAMQRLADSLAFVESLAKTSDNQRPNPSSSETNNTSTIVQDSSRTRLIRALALYAVSNSEILNEQMETAPDAVKPALEKAIADTTESYNRAIKAIEEGHQGLK